MPNKKDSSLERCVFGPGGVTICSGESELISNLIVPLQSSLGSEPSEDIALDKGAKMKMPKEI